MEQPQIPKNVQRLGRNEVFSFSCHPGVDCFTNCCRQLELALTPYDVLRLKRETKVDSSTFLENYVIQEQEPGEVFPRFYLTMVDDGQASCVFVSKNGCTVYPGRPGACRAYPMGRAAIRQADNSMEDFFVLLREPHCHGFAENSDKTSITYSDEQGLKDYNYFNDLVAAVLQHDRIRQGMTLTAEQTTFLVMALYDLDMFREKITDGLLPNSENYDPELHDTDEKLLSFGITWLCGELFKS